MSAEVHRLSNFTPRVCPLPFVPSEDVCSRCHNRQVQHVEHRVPVVTATRTRPYYSLPHSDTCFIEFSRRMACIMFLANYKTLPSAVHILSPLLVLFLSHRYSSPDDQTMHPSQAGPATLTSPPVSSEVKSRGVHFPDSTPLTASPESYESPLPPEVDSRSLGLSVLFHPGLDRVPVIDPRLQMIKRRSQCETRLSPLCSLRMTTGVPFPESSPYAPTNFTPNQALYPVRSHPLNPWSCLLTVFNR